jgi:hypothetical protein
MNKKIVYIKSSSSDKKMMRKLAKQMKPALASLAKK